MRGKSGTCGETTKGTAEREETSTSSMEKDARVQWYMGHAPKRYSIRRERLEDRVEGGDICRVWWMQL